MHQIKKTTLDFKYPHINDPVLREMKKLASIKIAPGATDLEKAQTVLGYAHNLFEHNGANQPSTSDPITILKEAKLGKSFRCVEYSLLGVALLWAYGVPARIIGLKTADVETREYGAGHVVVELWDRDLRKWVMCDVQQGIIPMADDKPLSALEFGQAISQKSLINLIPVDNLRSSYVDVKLYVDWISEYLYFYDTPLETTFANIDRKKQKIVMLVPRGIKPPKVFQNTFTMNVVHTNDASNFYPGYNSPEKNI
jgi:hypothetical protein